MHQQTVTLASLSPCSFLSIHRFLGPAATFPNQNWPPFSNTRPRPKTRVPDPHQMKNYQLPITNPSFSISAFHRFSFFFSKFPNLYFLLSQFSPPLAQKNTTNRNPFKSSFRPLRIVLQSMTFSPA
jgi:hypothetical protein